MRIPVLSLISLLLGAAAGCVPTMRRAPQAAAITRQQPKTSGALWPGRQADGSVLLPNQWSLRPVGKQVSLADFPVNVAVHPGGRYAAVLHAGYSRHQILIVDLPAAQTVSRTDVSQAFYGLQFSSDGAALFCSGAGEEVIHAFAFRAGQLSEHREVRLREAKEKGVPAGLAVDRAASRLYVANLWAHRITQVDLSPEAMAEAEPLLAVAVGLALPGVRG